MKEGGIFFKVVFEGLVKLKRIVEFDFSSFNFVVFWIFLVDSFGGYYFDLFLFKLEGFGSLI